MLPYLVGPEGSKSASRQERALPLIPPLHFRPLSSHVTNSRLRLSDYITAEGLTASQKNGLRYERAVQCFLYETFHDYYHPAPYIHFEDGGVARTCQPDGFLMDQRGGGIFLFEIKYQHCPEAWWQLVKLYTPLLQRLYPQHKVSCVEICRSYDPSTPFPCPITLVEDIEKWTSEPRIDFGVLRWRQ